MALINACLSSAEADWLILTMTNAAISRGPCTASPASRTALYHGVYRKRSSESRAFPSRSQPSPRNDVNVSFPRISPLRGSPMRWTPSLTFSAHQPAIRAIVVELLSRVALLIRFAVCNNEAPATEAPVFKVVPPPPVPTR
jgi:hypothetical protein